MAVLNFNAALFDSQCTPDPLPELPEDNFPPDCGLSADQKSMLGMHSEWLGVLDSPAKVVKHWELLNEQRAAKVALEAKERSKDPVERARIAEARGTHTTVVNAARVRWREAVAERERVVAEHNAKVKALHDEFTRLKHAQVI